VTDLAPDARLALAWALVLAVVGFGGMLFKRWFVQRLEATENLPSKRWYGIVTRRLERLKRSVSSLRSAVARLNERQDEQIVRQGKDHERLGTVEDDVGRLRIKDEIKEWKPGGRE